jgi:hypothetical protein
MSKQNEEIKLVYQFKSREEWVQAMQFEPNPNWVKTRELGSGKKSTYIPLPIQQALADKFYREWDVVQEEYQLITNEILCTVTIEYLPDYPFSEHRKMTGSASKPIQQNQGTAASLYPDGKKTNALEYNGPAARASAISNAFTTTANIFGRNLSRDIKSNFSFITEKEKENGSKE